MTKKYVFLDLDGTLIDHTTNSVPKSTLNAIKKAQNNGHELFICTGRIPGLFEGIDKKLGIHNYIAANGRLVVVHDEIIYSKYMTESYVEDFVDYVYGQKIDVAFESFDDYVLNSHFNTTTDRFLEMFHLEVTDVVKDYHKKNRVYQMNLMFSGDYTEIKNKFPHFHYSQANEFGIDVIEGKGMKEVGIKIVLDYLNIDHKYTIAIGDGYNDISMVEYAYVGVAMGNANETLKKKADYITTDVSNDGIYNAFIKLGLIKNDSKK